MDRGAWQATIHRVAKSWTNEWACVKHVLSKSIGTIFLYHDFLGLCIVFGDSMVLNV